MVQAPPQIGQVGICTFEQYLNGMPENSEHRYELHDGFIVEMLPPTAPHEAIASFLMVELTLEIRKQQLRQSIPKTCIVKPYRERSGYIPDVVVLHQDVLTKEALYQKASTVQRGESIALVIEVVSTNWRDEYLLKFGEYEAMQIPEYWLVDYQALGATRYTGKPKQPTITLCTLVEGEYRIQAFRAGQDLQSTVFPALKLSVDQIFNAAQTVDAESI